MSDLSNSGNWLLDNGTNLVVAIVIVLVGIWLAGFVKKLIISMSKKYERLDETLFSFFGSMARYAILAFTAIIVLERFGVETTSLVAIIGAASLAIGLALQGALSNLAAGVMLLMFRPFKIGDFIEGADTFGKVSAITLFTTDIETFDHQHIIIPNSSVWGAKIINHSHYPVRGVDMTVGVSYNADLKKAQKVILDTLAANEHVLADPAPFVEVETLNDSSVDFLLRPYCNGDNYFDVRYSVPQQIKEALDKAGIEIPFPQRVVHMVK